MASFILLTFLLLLTLVFPVQFQTIFSLPSPLAERVHGYPRGIDQHRRGLCRPCSTHMALARAGKTLTLIGQLVNQHS